MPGIILELLQHTMSSLVTPLKQYQLPLISSYLWAVHRYVLALWVLGPCLSRSLVLLSLSTHVDELRVKITLKSSIT